MFLLVAPYSGFSDTALLVVAGDWIRVPCDSPVRLKSKSPLDLCWLEEGEGFHSFSLSFGWSTALIP